MRFFELISLEKAASLPGASNMAITAKQSTQYAAHCMPFFRWMTFDGVDILITFIVSA